MRKQNPPGNFVWILFPEIMLDDIAEIHIFQNYFLTRLKIIIVDFVSANPAWWSCRTFAHDELFAWICFRDDVRTVTTYHAHTHTPLLVTYQSHMKSLTKCHLWRHRDFCVPECKCASIKISVHEAFKSNFKNVNVITMTRLRFSIDILTSKISIFEMLYKLMIEFLIRSMIHDHHGHH